jgi:hypothetical protein
MIATYSIKCNKPRGCIQSYDIANCCKVSISTTLKDCRNNVSIEVRFATSKLIE